MPREPNPLARIQLERNALTRGDWESFAPHRRRVTALILAAASSHDPSLCVLGAGNGNDLDLASLDQCFEAITLIDLDQEALQHCLGSQAGELAARIETLSGCDLSGLLKQIDHSPRIDRAIARAMRPITPPTAKTYDVVVSTCLLTQMIDSVVTAFGADHPRLAELALALRDGHLRMLSDLTADGGTALLVSDFVSSDTVPLLRDVPEERLEGLLARAIEQRNFFTGVNPRVLARQLALIGRGEATLHHPWRWRMGNRAYGVCAVSLRSQDR